MNWLDLLAKALRKLTTKELPGLQKQMYAYIDSKHRIRRNIEEIH